MKYDFYDNDTSVIIFLVVFKTIKLMVRHHL